MMGAGPAPPLLWTLPTLLHGGILAHGAQRLVQSVRMLILQDLRVRQRAVLADAHEFPPPSRPRELFVLFRPRSPSVCAWLGDVPPRDGHGFYLCGGATATASPNKNPRLPIARVPRGQPAIPHAHAPVGGGSTTSLRCDIFGFVHSQCSSLASATA